MSINLDGAAEDFKDLGRLEECEPAIPNSEADESYELDRAEEPDGDLQLYAAATTCSWYLPASQAEHAVTVADEAY